MKKLLAILLTLALLVTLTGTLSGCEKKQKPLRVLVDLDGLVGAGDGFSPISSMTFADTLEQIVIANGGPTDVEYELLPKDGAERKSAMTRLRTEIMAGNGPDVFIMAFYRDFEDWYEPAALFLHPEKSRELGLFYPLDDYIENARFMQWDKLTPVIMEAGRSEEWGQVILPLAYTFPITAFNKSEVTHTPSREMTYQDLIRDETLWGAAVPAGYENLGSESLGKIADYASKKLLITEEELLQRGREQAELTIKYYNETEGGWDLSNINHWNTKMAVAFDGIIPYNEAVGGADQPATLVPVYSDDGGITATVTAWAAINATCKRPDDAFFILDLLLSRNVQQDSLLYQFLTVGVGVPVYEGLMNYNTPVRSSTGAGGIGTWAMKPEDYETFCQLRDCITAVRIYSSMEMLVGDTFTDFINMYNRNEPDTTAEDAAKLYMRLKQELSE